MNRSLAQNQKQYELRIRWGSEMDKALRAISNSETPLTEMDLANVTGLRRSEWLLETLLKQTDNARLTGSKKTGLHLNYVDIVPTIPIPVGTDMVDAATVARVVAVETVMGSSTPHVAVESMTWPQMPPVPLGIEDKFRQPSWFNLMLFMVQEGKHISLAGGPGTGKDTAIIELAAQEGKVLVTVGGDGGLRKRDLVGTTEIVSGSTTFKVAEFAAAVVNGWWASITEINAADPDVIILLNACMAPPYIININGKAYPVHKNFTLFVSYNPGLIGTKPLPQSFKDRFFSIQVPFYNRTSLKAVLGAHGMPEDMRWAECILDFGMAMNKAFEDGKTRYQITSRRLQDTVVLMNNGESSVKTALKLAVLAAIDSPVEYRAAEQVLNSLVI